MFMSESGVSPSPPATAAGPAVPAVVQVPVEGRVVAALVLRAGVAARDVTAETLRDVLAWAVEAAPRARLRQLVLVGREAGDAAPAPPWVDELGEHWQGEHSLGEHSLAEDSLGEDERTVGSRSSRRWASDGVARWASGRALALPPPETGLFDDAGTGRLVVVAGRTPSSRALVRAMSRSLTEATRMSELSGVTEASGSPRLMSGSALYDRDILAGTSLGAAALLGPRARGGSGSGSGRAPLVSPKPALAELSPPASPISPAGRLSGMAGCSASPDSATAFSFSLGERPAAAPRPALSARSDSNGSAVDRSSAGGGDASSLSMLRLQRAFTSTMGEKDKADIAAARPSRNLRDEFILGDRLGQGGFATVFSAVHIASRREVAVKMVLLEREAPEPVTRAAAAPATDEAGLAAAGHVAEQQQQQQQQQQQEEEEDPAPTEEELKAEHDRKIANFMFEISVLRRLREELPLQPNLIRFYGVCLDHSPAEALCLVMEKLNGGELFDRIVERQRYTEKDAGHLFRGIVRAVSALHKANILHRDIKPENVLFVDTSYYSPFRLVDYGSAMFLDAPEKDPFKDKRIGSPGYTAPEVITNKPDRYKPPCDVFALGVLLFCLLVGYQPFPPEGPTYTLNVVTAHFDMDDGWDEVSEQAKDLVRKMLARSPLARISTADILAHPWVTDVELGPEERPLAGAQQGLKTMGFRKRFKGAALAAVWSARERLGRILN